LNKLWDGEGAKSEAMSERLLVIYGQVLRKIKQVLRRTKISSRRFGSPKKYQDKQSSLRSSCPPSTLLFTAQLTFPRYNYLMIIVLLVMILMVVTVVVIMMVMVLYLYHDTVYYMSPYKDIRANFKSLIVQ
jgi:Flp pilus assembly protein TadB